MFDKIIAFFMSIILAIANLFGLGAKINTYEFRNVSYGTHERQTLDLNIPKDAEGDLGLVLFIHGGAWIAGDKGSYEKGVESTASSFGFAGASLNYRYIGDNVSLHDELDDIQAALQKIKEIGAENGVNINKVLLTGDSAGGHLSLLYAYSRADVSPITPVAVVSNSGPTDLYDDNFYHNNAIGDEESIANLFSYGCGQRFAYGERDEAKEALMKVSPVSYVNEKTVPTVINHGMKDSIVPYSNAQTLDKLLTQYGVTHVLNAYPNSDHDLGADEANSDIASDLLIEYCNTYLK